jgi:MFS family permease
MFRRFVTVFGFGVAQPFLPLYAREMDTSETVVGLLISSYFITRLFIELPSGIISDRVGRRIPLLTGMSLSFLGAVICSLAHDLPFLVLGRAVWGMGTALFFSSSTAFIFDLFETSVRSQAMGTFQSIEFIVSVVCAPLGGLIAAYIGM